MKSRRAQKMKMLGTGIVTTAFVLITGISLHAATVNCGAALGTQFNLEPAAKAMPQELEAVDFIPNRVALNEDLVVGGAYDFRGVPFASGTNNSAKWDGSVSGYYVRRSATPGCAPQFEGGLPAITAAGASFTGNGGVQIAADPARDAFFVADLRYSAVAPGMSAIGLFRASSATLLDSKLCPNGTHTVAKATSCWEATAPAIIDPISSGGINNADDYPSIAVDERTTSAGVGAGDVYVAYEGSNEAGGVVVKLVACANSTLSCSAPLIISASGENVAFNGTEATYVQVRPDGNITVTYLDQTSETEDSPIEIIKFVMCTPGGAPNAPVCSAATEVATETQTIGTFDLNEGLSGENFFIWTNARHANRLEADGTTITTFVVWDRCAEYFTFIPGEGPMALCLNADVLMSTSTDGGNTWADATAVNTSAGHQFFPSISTDASTGTVNIAYYDTLPDSYRKRMAVSLNQIAAGTTTVGATMLLTTTAIPWDADPNQTPFPLDDVDFHFGIKARGMGTAGNSRVYASFTSTGDRPGSYIDGQLLPEQNNNLQELIY